VKRRKLGGGRRKRNPSVISSRYTGKGVKGEKKERGTDGVLGTKR